MLQGYKLEDGHLTKDAVKPGVERYWPIRYELAMKDGIEMKCKCVIISCFLQKQILQQLHSNDMGIKKIYMDARGAMYWINMNADFETLIVLDVLNTSAHSHVKQH